MAVRDLLVTVKAAAVRLGNRVPSNLRRAITSYNDQRGSEAAASMAYYAFLSLFPLLIFLVAAASLLLEQERVYTQLRILLEDFFPLPSEVLKENLDQILQLSASVGVIAFATLLWSGIGFFSVLSHHINRAWPDARLRTFLGLRVMGLKIAGVLLLLLILSVILSLGTNLLPRIPLIQLLSGGLFFTSGWQWFSNIVPWLVSLLFFFGLYRGVPNTHVRGRAALIGALVASVAWQVLTQGFTWYLGSGVASYEVIYGSLGGVVALLFWIYLSNLIAIFGAHLTAAIDTARPRQQRGDPEMRSTDESTAP